MHETNDSENTNTITVMDIHEDFPKNKQENPNQWHVPAQQNGLTLDLDLDLGIFQCLDCKNPWAYHEISLIASHIQELNFGRS